ncbi:Pimeloyl-ACP methyl ester carboxylesterase [Streptomyces sp. DvalAA-14]|uniref:alpha/beta fold hydrolase n=1 Tax=unclassified Streptomyces TaxID=2593676 RepID=UPI00081AFF29|nr:MULTISPECIES: alpha/beta hydrolase [unclassified Streptomyces]MYS23040.1 alpha/beta fold hydrolase [Streptomyces sp. SID4948]SCE26455.1 Pimeloyl-ACP methyl ester carboxylesterase [Streptomyces sp. DvalAA-14]
MATPARHPLSQGTHSVEIQGVTQRYHVHGTGPVVVAHSGGPGIFWEYLRMPAVEEHLTVVYPEPVGTGGSGRLPNHPHGYTRARYAGFLDALIDHLAIPRVHLLGHSHGGFVAQHYALHHPDRLAGIILYESAPATGPEFQAEAVRNVGEFARKFAGRPELPQVLGALQSVPDISDDEEFAAAAQGLLPAYFADYWAHEEEWASFRAAVGGSYISGLDADRGEDTIDDRQVLGKLDVPALIVVGRHDVICGVRWSEELHGLIPGSELLVLEDSGHFGHIEEPGRFARAVTAFVASTPA